MRGLAITAASCAAVALLAGVPAASAKEAGDLLVRVRGIYVVPDESSSLSLAGTGIPGEANVGNHFVPELDFTYFLNDNVGIELILGTTPHNVNATGTPLGAKVDLGDVWLLPPTLTAQYHFNPKGQVSPYIGLGVNYTIFYNVDEGAARDIDYDNSFGFALQAGVDFALNERWSLNLDVKKLWLSTDVSIDAGLPSRIKADVDLDPWIIGVGFGYRF
ncbi:OmpW/AlkL family protein [Rhodospirillum centenum]|uniref:Outer membrane protein OmpW, putative n=1 Tax=Rhodospirillum centenum (strain ATCC 51521 / SW) TaxID=414684 RepID=B6INB2_RHOCS|nr:OmpW family protein [Rhodospirillum centenum]ACI99009.1 outer membrane protein OmpW, putative [Rhodospirillum centenum SW]